MEGNARILGDGSALSGADGDAGMDSLEVTLVRSSDSGSGYGEQPMIVQVDSGVASLSQSQSSITRVPSSPRELPGPAVAASPAPPSGVTPPRFAVSSTSPVASRTPTSPIDLTAFGVPALDYRMGTPQQTPQQQQANQPFPGAGMARIPEMEAGYAYNGRTMPPASHMDADDDERTEPSSTVTGNTGDNGNGSIRTDQDPTSTFGRIIHNTRRRLSSGSGYERNPSGSLEEDDFVDGALIYGYLQKLGRNGKWQTRWFETDGETLTYYKSNKRKKLLATLDLAKVGSIDVNHHDPKGRSFTINISERLYELRADSKSACKDWVITLNRIKEARMQEGNVKLVSNHPQQHENQPRPMVDLLDQSNSSSGYAPRVVVVANRQRTRKVDEGALDSWENRANWQQDPANPEVEVGFSGTANPYVGKRKSSSNHLARWRKSSGSIDRMADKFLRWARSLRKFGCTSDADRSVVLDHQSYPPPYHSSSKQKSMPMDFSNPTHTDSSFGGGSSVAINSHNAWIGKEKAVSTSGNPGAGIHSIASGLIQPSSVGVDDLDDGTHELS